MTAARPLPSPDLYEPSPLLRLADALLIGLMLVVLFGYTFLFGWLIAFEFDRVML